MKKPATHIRNAKSLNLAVACALALGFASSATLAQNSGPISDKAVVVNSTGLIWKSSDGRCVRSSYGPPPVPSAECDPNFKPEVAPKAAVVPAPKAAVAAAPIPAPRKVIVTKMTLDADALFDFNKAALRPEGKAELDAMVSKLQGVDIDSVTAVGHTDRLGSDRYNQGLSEKRAEVVKDYLIAKGVPANRVQSKGMGESQPVTKAGECRGAKSVKVVACLQADRRVDIDVAGAKTTQ